MDDKYITYDLSNVNINFKNIPLIISIHDNCHDYSLCLLSYETGEILLHLEYERILKFYGKRLKGEYYNNIFIKGISNVSNRVPLVLIALIDNNIIRAQDIKYYIYCDYAGLSVYKDIYKNFQKNKLGITNNPCRKYRIPHHLNHLAYSFYTSPFEKSEVFSYDSWGTLTDCMFGHVNRTINLNQLYLTVIGVGVIYDFAHNYLKISSGSLMGLSSFGKYRKEYENVLIGLANNQKVIYGCKKFISHNRYNELCDWRYRWSKTNHALSSKTSINALLSKISIIWTYIKFLPALHKNTLAGLKEKRNAKDFAKTTQVLFEETTMDMVLNCFNKKENLCLSGGCALNLYMNELLKKHFKNIYVPPACNDAGQSIGATLYFYHNILGRNRNYSLNQNIAYLGLSYSINENELRQFEYVKFNDWNLLLKKVSKLLWSDKIVAWYQGRSESGPRALGNRCILANPFSLSNKIKLNCIKRRKPWRPVAPIMTKEAVLNSFESNGDHRYMLFNPKVRKSRVKKIPAIVHIDKTSRVQTVTREQNEKMYGLLKEFSKLSGAEILCNTSFNIKEPIVDSPQDALRTLKESNKRKHKIDFLVIGNYLITNRCF